MVSRMSFRALVGMVPCRFLSADLKAYTNLDILKLAQIEVLYEIDLLASLLRDSVVQNVEACHSNRARSRGGSRSKDTESTDISNTYRSYRASNAQAVGRCAPRQGKRRRDASARRGRRGVPQ